jgi:hypothetical protein
LSTETLTRRPFIVVWTSHPKLRSWGAMPPAVTSGAVASLCLQSTTTKVAA